MRNILRVGSLVLFASSTGACTLAQIAQLRKPEAAQAPAVASFPEAERLIPQAAWKFPPGGTLERAYMLDEQWETLLDDSARRVAMEMYYRRPGGALVKDENGGTGDVCFRYDCTLAQPFIGGGVGSPTIECNEAMMRKVTCGSVAALPPGLQL